MNYEVSNHQLYRVDDEGIRTQMSNFAAQITEEVHYIDGLKSTTWLTITGTMPNPEASDDQEAEPIHLPEVKIEADSFGGMTWVLPNWGVRAVIRPGTSIKDDLRAAIQLGSRPKVQTVYKHLGWTRIGRHSVYLHAGGGIGPNGNSKNVRVELPQDLSRYFLDDTVPTKEAFDAMLLLTGIAPPSVSWPLLAATITPLLGPVDFAIHLAGRTGTFKSELMSLYQSFYGAGMDARHLPGSWSSTANALEAQAFYAKNAAFVVDDFVPSGTSWQVRAYQQTADKIIRAQGNQAGRARLTDVSSLQQTMYPRGIVLSTGEDTPEGHSVRARMLILEMTPGDIEPAKLTEAQKVRKSLSGVIAAIARYISRQEPDLTELINEERSKHLQTGHSRTPSMLARLIITLDFVFEWATVEGLISEDGRRSLMKVARAAIVEAGEKQAFYLEDADPVDIFRAAIRQVLGAGLGHLRSMNGGVPSGAQMLGWTKETAAGEMPVFKSRGPTIGWVNWRDDQLFIDVTAGYNIIKKAAAGELSLTKQTLFKRLKDSGALVRTDDTRQRNTIRVTAEGHPRTALALSIADTLDMKEKPSDD